MAKELFLLCLEKLRKYAEETKRDDLLDAVEDAEKVVLEEVLGLTYLQDRPLNENLLGGAFPSLNLQKHQTRSMK